LCLCLCLCVCTSAGRFLRASEMHLNDMDQLAALLDAAPPVVAARLRRDFAESYAVPGSDVERYSTHPETLSLCTCVCLCACVCVCLRRRATRGAN
jgi:hypothetical protein